MKKLNFETIKGKFVVVDMPEHRGKAMALALLCNSNFDKKEFKDSTYLGYISELTEQQASEIVDSIFRTFYTFDGWGASEDPILTLHCLIKSNGYYLFDTDTPKDKTFFNPIIFKLL